MAITDLRFAASLLKSGFTAAEVKTIIGMSGSEATVPAEEQPPENTPEPEPEEQIDSDVTDPDQDGGTDQGEPEPEPEQPEPEPEKPKQNPLTRNEAGKSESLVDTLSKLL